MAQVNNFCVAGHDIQIIIEDSKYNTTDLIDSFEPFRVDAIGDDPLFRLTIDDTIRPVPKEHRHRIRAFDTGNGDTVVDKIDDGGYQYIIKNLEGYECALLIADKEFGNCRCALNGNFVMRDFGLNSALMLIMAFAGARRQTLLIHASLVRCDGRGYAFTAKSGTGKSTQVSMWLRYIPNCDLMNDDNPIVRIINGKPYIFGGPWSGKTPCYRNVKAPLGAITLINRDKKNWIEKLGPLEAFAAFLPSCSAMKWDVEIYDAICDTITKVVETTGIYILHCLPNEEAAVVCHNAVAK